MASLSDCTSSRKRCACSSYHTSSSCGRALCFREHSVPYCPPFTAPGQHGERGRSVLRPHRRKRTCSAVERSRCTAASSRAPWQSPVSKHSLISSPAAPRSRGRCCSRARDSCTPHGVTVPASAVQGAASGEQANGRCVAGALASASVHARTSTSPESRSGRVPARRCGRCAPQTLARARRRRPGLPPARQLPSSRAALAHQHSPTHVLIVQCVQAPVLGAARRRDVRTLGETPRSASSATRAAHHLTWYLHRRQSVRARISRPSARVCLPALSATCWCAGVEG